jgi:hypothetical protein
MKAELLPAGWAQGNGVFYLARRQIDANVRLDILYLKSQEAFVGKIYTPQLYEYGVTVDLTSCKSTWTAALTMNTLYKTVLKNYSAEIVRTIIC